MYNASRWRTVTGFCSALLLLMPLTGPVSGAADMEPIGADEYRISCQSCHGSEGKGDGPMVQFLTMQPTDLTRIAINNEGIFPLEKVFRIIDGRDRITAHGDREMPVWGARYLNEDSSRYGSLSGEQVVRLRILELVYYIHSMQQN